jgi:hypothetical protein
VIAPAGLMLFGWVEIAPAGSKVVDVACAAVLPGIARPANKDVAVRREANGKSKRSERRMKAVKLDRVGYLQ